MLRIHALTVCVNYADYLGRGFQRWCDGLVSWTIVTDHADTRTPALVRAHARAVGESPVLKVFQTDVFYAQGAAFNKGAAMEEARLHMPWDDWILFVDADVVPERDWYAKVLAAGPKPGSLYGAWRYQCAKNSDPDDPALPKIRGDGVAVGYFQLFHSSDPAVQGPLPIVETHWLHAGNYDNGFMRRWDRRGRGLRKTLPIRLAHFGDRDNWFGRGRKEDFAAMQAERKRRGGWQHERIES